MTELNQNDDKILFFCSSVCAPCKDLEKKLVEMNYSKYEKVNVDTKDGNDVVSRINKEFPCAIRELPTLFNATKRILVKGNIPKQFLRTELKKLHGLA